MRRCHSTAGSTFFVAIANDLQYGMENVETSLWSGFWRRESANRIAGIDGLISFPGQQRAA
jgi:hypothetical protein